MNKEHKHNHSEDYHDEMQPNPQPPPSLFGLGIPPALMFAEFFNVHGGLPPQFMDPPSHLWFGSG